MCVVGRGVCPHAGKYPQKTEDTDPSGSGITGGCELPDVGNGI